MMSHVKPKKISHLPFKRTTWTVDLIHAGYESAANMTFDPLTLEIEWTVYTGKHLKTPEGFRRMIAW
jgi:hypothetical protein